MTPYRRIACSAYDQLEAFATRRVPVLVTWQDDDGATHEATARLDDLFSDAHGEWMRLSDGRAVRLDHVRRIAEAAPPLESGGAQTT